jgi:hypothetical protein
VDRFFGPRTLVFFGLFLPALLLLWLPSMAPICVAVTGFWTKNPVFLLYFTGLVAPLATFDGTDLCRVSRANERRWLRRRAFRARAIFARKGTWPYRDYALVVCTCALGVCTCVLGVCRRAQRRSLTTYCCCRLVLSVTYVTLQSGCAARWCRTRAPIQSAC